MALFLVLISEVQKVNHKSILHFEKFVNSPFQKGKLMLEIYFSSVTRVRSPLKILNALINVTTGGKVT